MGDVVGGEEVAEHRRMESAAQTSFWPAGAMGQWITGAAAGTKARWLATVGLGWKKRAGATRSCKQKRSNW